MGEKQYGGASSHGVKSTRVSTSSSSEIVAKKEKKEAREDTEEFNSEKYIKAGRIASQVVAYAKSIIKPGIPLLEIAEKIDAKIHELKAKPAFPVNLSIDKIAAHATPLWNDEQVASGLLKVDIGVHIDGYAADTAFSLDLEGTPENKKLIEAAELALANAIKKAGFGIKLREIGREIEHAIKSKGFQPIQNLSGHSISRYELHAGLTIPNFDNSQENTLEEGVIAIEPFSTSGLGAVKDGKPSSIYRLEQALNVRDMHAREVLDFILDEYNSLPFCARWIYKKFGSRGLLSLRRLEEAGVLHQYPQLIERSEKKVAQAEHTIIIEKGKKIVTTE